MAIVPKTQTSAVYYVQHPFDLIKGLSSDVVGFAVIFLAIMVYGLYRGKESLVSLLISLYVGMVAYTSSTFLKSLLFFRENNTQIFFSKAIVYIIVVILITLVINKIIGVSFTMSKVRSWIEVAIISFAVAASFVVIAFNTLSLSLAYNPSLISANLLSSSTALFWTLVGSFAILFFTVR